MGGTSRETPSVAFGLTLAGGIIILLAGVVVMVVGAVLTFFIAGLGGIFGLVGVVWGVLIIVCAVMLRSMPDQHVGLGVAIIIFSVLSWFGSFGGLVIGFLLALVGGILAIVWKPGVASVNVSVSSAPTSATAQAMVSTGSTRFCPNCGSPTDSGSKFCRNCGRTL